MYNAQIQADIDYIEALIFDQARIEQRARERLANTTDLVNGDQ